MDVWMEILCTALTVTYATNPYTVLLLPKGDCHLCCPYHRDDIKLYMNIPGGPEEVYFDWENGSDWRLLDNNRTIAVYIHGFTEQHNGPAASEIRRAYRERGEDNLLVVDWAPLAAAPWYHGAVANTPHVGQFLAGVIDSLVIRGLPLDRFHVIGFSLGAEIAGLLAKRITVGKLSRVTGLDPALPLYDPLKPSGRLARSDAEFVDVIHTDGGFFGFASQLGHADFFPNGGRPAQPGCRAEILVHTGKLKDFVACSHNRAWKYFAESVRDPYAFPAIPCQSFLAYQKGKCKPSKEATDLPAFMGYRADPSLRGKFFLETKDKGPYGLGPHESSPDYESQPSPYLHESNPTYVHESSPTYEPQQPQSQPSPYVHDSNPTYMHESSPAYEPQQPQTQLSQQPYPLYPPAKQQSTALGSYYGGGGSSPAAESPTYNELGPVYTSPGYFDVLYNTPHTGGAARSSEYPYFPYFPRYLPQPDFQLPVYPGQLHPQRRRSAGPWHLQTQRVPPASKRLWTLARRYRGH